MKKNNLLKTTFALLTVVAITSCAKEIAFEDEPDTSGQRANSTLIVKTRVDASVDDGAGTISYPVNVYVFDEEDLRCIERSTLTEESKTLTLTLQEGIYNVYAIAGADEERYDLPTKANATPKSAITLKEGKRHNDLLASTGSFIELKKGGKNTLTLSLNRKVMMIKDITIKGLPETIDAVSLSLSPLHSSILLNGGYEDTDKKHSVKLSKDDSGNWTDSTATYLPPASADASITVSVTSGSETTTYTYTCSDQLQANHKISIVGTYDSGELEMSGTIKGEEWGEDKRIEFTFKKTDTTPEEPTPDPVSEIPAIGTLYNNTCFVVDSVRNDDNTTTITVVSGKEVDHIFITDKDYTQKQVKDIINKNIGNVTVEGIEGWQVLNSDVVKKMLALEKVYERRLAAYLAETGQTIKESPIKAYSTHSHVVLEDGKYQIYTHSLKRVEDRFLTTTGLRVFTTITFE